MTESKSNVKDCVGSFENLYEAMKKCKSGASHKDSACRFTADGLANCLKLSEQIENDTYNLGKQHTFYITEPKLRKITSYTFKDRVVQRSLCDNYLTERLSRSFVYDNAACQVGKGTDFFRRRLKAHMQKFFRKHGLFGYVYKFDIANYFGSTRHDIAYQTVAERVDDEWALSLISKMIQSYNYEDILGVGLSLGSQVTQIIQLAVLDDLDHFIKEKLHIKYYVRYMDDFILIHEDKEYLKECRKQIEGKLSELGLRLNAKKSQLTPLSQPVKALGFSFRLTDTGKVIMRVLPEKISKQRRKLRKLVKLSREGKIPRSEVDDSFRSWISHLEHGNCYNLIKSMREYYIGLWED